MSEEFKSGGTREPVRSSMVLMTGKLLGVSEGIAAMNLRIAAGVVLCIILLIATFVVNVVAFDFAKSEEKSGDNMMVDKKSGDLVHFHNKFVDHEFSEFSVENMNLVKEIYAPLYNNGQGSYIVESKERFECKGSHLCAPDGFMYVVTVNNGHQFYWSKNVNNGLLQWVPIALEADKAYVAEAGELAFATTEAEHKRSLLMHGGPITTCTTMMCISSHM